MILDFIHQTKTLNGKDGLQGIDEEQGDLQIVVKRRGKLGKGRAGRLYRIKATY